MLDLDGGNTPDEMGNYLVKSVTLLWICVFERQRASGRRRFHELG
jgi:hypothetical protein